MADIATTWARYAGEGDWQIAGPALLAGDDLATGVLVSLFTDRQANADAVIPDGSSDRRGWWGNPTMGSRLWLLSRSKQGDEPLRRAEEYAVEALDWMRKDGVTAAVTATATWVSQGVLGLVVQLKRRDGSILALPYAWAWDGAAIPPTVRLPAVTMAGELDFGDPNNAAYLNVI